MHIKWKIERLNWENADILYHIPDIFIGRLDFTVRIITLIDSQLETNYEK